MSDVIKFPIAPLEENTKRHWNAVFDEAYAKGFSKEQVEAVLLQTLKENGFVEIDGVWQIPGTLPQGWKWPESST